MKMCKPHWDRLQDALKVRGLERFIANSSEELKARLDAQETLGMSAGFEPLWAAHLAILSNALDMAGLYLMGAKEDGSEYCPICESEAHNGPGADWWFDHAADEQLAKARELGLMPKEEMQ